MSENINGNLNKTHFFRLGGLGEFSRCSLGLRSVEQRKVKRTVILIIVLFYRFLVVQNWVIIHLI